MRFFKWVKCPFAPNFPKKRAWYKEGLPSPPSDCIVRGFLAVMLMWYSYCRAWKLGTVTSATIFAWHKQCLNSKWACYIMSFYLEKLFLIWRRFSILSYIKFFIELPFLEIFAKVLLPGNALWDINARGWKRTILNFDNIEIFEKFYHSLKMYTYIQAAKNCTDMY